MERVAEKTIVAAIMRWLKQQPDVYAWKTVGTTFGRRGLPDIVGNVGGRALYLEVKAADGRASPRQLAEHRRIRSSGSACFVVRSQEESIEAVRALRTAVYPNGDLGSEGKPSWWGINRSD